MATATNELSVKFKSVVSAVLKRDGLDDTQFELATDLVEFINDRLRKAWSHEFWPQTMRIEKKHYHQIYCAGLTYNVGDVLWDSSDYFICNTETQNDTTTADWTKIEGDIAFDKVIPYWQNGSLPTDAGSEIMHRVRSVSMRNPRRSGLPGFLNYSIYSNGIQVSDLSANEVWVTYQIKPPEFTLTEIQADVTYNPRDAFGHTATYADILYDDTSGECYEAIAVATSADPFTDDTKWKKVLFPQFLQRYVVHASYADWLASEGQTAKSSIEDEYAEKLLFDLMDIYAPQEQVQQRVKFNRY